MLAFGIIDIGMLRTTSSEEIGFAVGEYKLLALLGSGTFSKVFKGLSPQGQIVALKMTPKSSRKSEQIHDAEIEALLRLRKCQNVVGLYDVFETESDWVLVLEFIEGCDLFHYVSRHKRLSEAETFKLLAPIAELLAIMHGEHRLTHRDLKLENIMIEAGTGRPVLIDFGLAVRYDSLLKMRCGSEEYAAPEIIIGKPYQGEHVDVWSFGVIFYGCLYGRLPFNKIGDIPVNSDHADSLFSQILFAPVPLPGLSREAEQLLSSILNRQDYKRPSFAEISYELALLHHHSDIPQNRE